MNNSEGQTQETVNEVSAIFKKYSSNAIRSVGIGCNNNEYILAKDFWQIIQEILQVFTQPHAPIKTEQYEVYKEDRGMLHGWYSSTATEYQSYPEYKRRIVSFNKYPIKTSEDERLKEVKTWIEERMAMFPDDPNLSERGAYDAYLNVLNVVNNLSLIFPSSIDMNVEALATAFADSKERRGCSYWQGLYNGFKAGYASFIPQSKIPNYHKIISETPQSVKDKVEEYFNESSTEEEKDLWDEIRRIVIKHFASYNYPDQCISELQSTYKISKR